MYFYCYVYVFLLLCMSYSVYSVFIVPTGTLQLPWLRFFWAFSSVVRQMLGYKSQRQGTVCTLPKLILFCLLCVCKCVLYCTTATGWQPICSYIHPSIHPSVRTLLIKFWHRYRHQRNSQNVYPTAFDQ